MGQELFYEGDTNMQTLQMLLIFRQNESDNLQEGPAEPPWKKMMDYTPAPQLILYIL